MNEKNLKNMTVSELADIITAFGGKKYLASYVFNFIHSCFAESIEEFTTASKDIRKKLVQAGYYISRLNTIEKLYDPDGTSKYLFEMPDGERLETVRLTDAGRTTVCISSQAGCKLGCKFCATGCLKFKRNLTAAEITDQVIQISKDAGKISNVVFMGMGEPLENYENVIKAVRILAHPKGLNIGIRKQTISTCGIIPGIKALADEDILPRLAVSLHAPTDDIRSRIMPIAKKYPLNPLISAMKQYQRKTSRRITIEYCMIKGINDSVQCAALTKLLRPLQINVNLIEYNPHPGCKLKPSSKETIKNFAEKLKSNGIETTIRFKRGQTIKAACGQLGSALLSSDKKEN